MRPGTTLDLGDPVIGIDPGSLSAGVCLMTSGGTVLGKWSIRPDKKAGPLRRLFYIYVQASEIFAEIEKAHGRKIEVGIEDGVFGGTKEPMKAAPMFAGKAGEIRGVLICLCWSCGWRVRKIAPITWKSRLPDSERKLKKTLTPKEYAAYYTERLGTECATADVADAVLIAAFMTGAQ